jgi:hypothetical protein
MPAMASITNNKWVRTPPNAACVVEGLGRITSTSSSRFLRQGSCGIGRPEDTSAGGEK